MMHVIWKYEISPSAPETKILLPKNAQLLCVGMQYQKPVLWFQVDPLQPKEERLFYVVPTGVGFEPVDTHYHAGTAVSDVLVWHVFEDMTGRIYAGAK